MSFGPQEEGHFIKSSYSHWTKLPLAASLILFCLEVCIADKKKKKAQPAS
jgi:hypothetical protein